MAVVLMILAVLIMIVGVILFTGWDKKRRSEKAGSAATGLGLEFVGEDTGIVRAYDFMLFRLEDAFSFHDLTDVPPRLTNVSRGSWNGAPVTTAELKYTNGNKTFRYGVAIVDVGGSLPRMSLSDERLINKLSKRRGLEDTELGKQRLSDNFEVRSDNNEFANAALNADISEWLCANGRGYSFETHGGAVAAYKRSAKPDQLGALVEVAGGFGEGIAPTARQ